MNLLFGKNTENKGGITDQLASLFNRPVPSQKEPSQILKKEHRRAPNDTKIYRVMSQGEFNIYLPVLRKYKSFILVGERFKYIQDLIEKRNELLDVVEDNDQKLIKIKLQELDEMLDMAIRIDDEGDKSRLINFLNLRCKPREASDVRAKNIYNDANNHYKKIDENTGDLVKMSKEEMKSFDKVEEALRFRFAVANHKGEATLEMITKKDEILDLLEMYKFKESEEKAVLFLEKFFKISQNS